MEHEEFNALTQRILAAAYRVHTVFGPGLLESAYSATFVFELRRSGFEVKTEVPVPVIYEGVKLTDIGFRIDILVDDTIVIEVKSVEAVAPVHLSQLVSYLKLSNRRVGLLINFNVASLKDGIYRRVHRF